MSRQDEPFVRASLQPETRNPKSEIRNPEPETRNPKSEIRNLKPGTLNCKL
jgi:hypothetical protein